MSFILRIALIVSALCWLAACGPNNETTLTEAKLSSQFLLETPKLTSEVTKAVARYLDRVHWQPIPLSATNGNVDPGGFIPFYIECFGVAHDGKRLIANIGLYDDFTPVVLEGEETPEYRAMAEALKTFRKRTPLKLKELYEGVLKEMTKRH